MPSLSDILGGLYQKIFPPQAMTRVTRTPVYWGHTSDPRALAEYNPNLNAITMSQDDPRLRQTNPSDQPYQGQILRHESVHALLKDQPEVTGQIAKSVTSDPFSLVPSTLQAYGYTPSAYNIGQELPAYVMQGETLNALPGSLNKYIGLMPPAIRKTYLTLLGPTSPDSAASQR